MNTWTTRLCMSLTVVIAFWAKPVGAQDVLVVPTVPYEPAHHPAGPMPFAPRPNPALSNRYLQSCFNSHGVGCQVDPYYPLCGNLNYELNFAFGSCRWFWNEPCHPNAPCYQRKPWIR